MRIKFVLTLLAVLALTACSHSNSNSDNNTDVTQTISLSSSVAYASPQGSGTALNITVGSNALLQQNHFSFGSSTNTVGPIQASDLPAGVTASYSNCDSVPIGGTCSITFTGTSGSPSLVGAHTITISGTGINTTTATLTIQWPTLNAPAVSISSQNITVSSTITNSSHVLATIGQLSLSSGWEFVSNTCNHTVLQPTQTCSYSIQATSSISAGQQAAVTIPVAEMENGSTLTSVTVVDPQSTITLPTSDNQIAINSNTSPQVITIANTGEVAIHTSYNITPIPFNDIQVVSTCPTGSNSLAVGGTCTITLSPGTITDNIHGTLTISADGSATQNLTLVSVADNGPILAASASTFYTLPTTPGAGLTYTITNNGGSTANNVHLTGLPAGVSANYTNCSSVAADSNCEVTLSGNGATPGSTSIVATSDDSNVTAVGVTLTVTWAQLTGSSLSFTDSNTTAESTITNQSPFPVSITAANIEGTDASNFEMISDQCSGQTLAASGEANSTCTISAKPTSTAANQSANISISSDEVENGTLAVSSLNSPYPSSSISPSTNNDTPTDLTVRDSVPATITITNTNNSGDIILPVSVQTSGTGFQVSSDSCSLAAEQECTLSLSADGTIPPAGGSGTVTVTVGGISYPYNVELIPTAIAISVSGSNETFLPPTFDPTSEAGYAQDNPTISIVNDSTVPNGANPSNYVLDIATSNLPTTVTAVASRWNNDSGGWSTGNGSCSQVAVGDTCQISLKTTAASGTITYDITGSNAIGNTSNTITGILNIQNGSISVSPISVTGTVPEAASTVTNDGETPVALGSNPVSITNTSEWQTADINCMNNILNAGDTCTFNVTNTSLLAGSSATISVSSSSLAADATAGAQMEFPNNFTVTVSENAGPSQTLGNTLRIENNNSYVITITNNDNELTLPTPTLVYDNSQGFSVTNHCSTNLAPNGGNCSIDLAIGSAANGSSTTLNIDSGDQTLATTNLLAGGLTVSVNSESYAAYSKLTLYNETGSSLSNLTITPSDTEVVPEVPYNESASNICSSTLANGSNCELWLKANITTPTANNAGTLSITADNGISKQLTLKRATYLYASGDNLLSAGNYLAKWDGSNWTAVSNPNSTVRALKMDLYGNLIAAGSFSYGVAKWDGTNWSTLLNSGTDFFNTTVNALSVNTSNNTIYASYNNSAAQWNGSSWSSYYSGYRQPQYALATNSSGDPIQTPYYSIYSYLYYPHSSYTAFLSMASSGDPANANKVFEMDSSGATFNTSTFNTGGLIYSYAVNSSSTVVYTGGSFTSNNSQTTNSIAYRFGSNWFQLTGGGLTSSSAGQAAPCVGTGANTNATVCALWYNSANNMLYAGGYFNQANSANISANIAAYNITNNQWTNVSGLSSTSQVKALAIGSQLCIGSTCTDL